MAAYCRVYDSRNLQADCQEPGSALEPYARYKVPELTPRLPLPFLVQRYIILTLLAPGITSAVGWDGQNKPNFITAAFSISSSLFRQTPPFIIIRGILAD